MHTKTMPLSADPMDMSIEKKEKIGMFGRLKNFVKEKVSKVFFKKSSDKADDSTKITIDHSSSTTSDITSKKFSGLQNFAHSKEFSSKTTNTTDINSLKLKMFEMAKSALPAEILALPAEEQQKFIDILYKNMYGSLAGAMELRSNSAKDILKLIWKNKKQVGLLICIGLVGGFIGASLAPVLLGALGGASVLGGAVFTGAFAGMSRIFITNTFTKKGAKSGQGMIDMNTIEEKVKKEFFNTENLKMIVDNSVKQYKISKLPLEIMSIQNEIELANAIRNYLQTSDSARFSALSEEQKTKEIAMYSALVKVYGNSLNMSVSAKNSSKSEFLKAGFLGGMAGAVGSSALLSSRISVVAVTSAIGGLIHSYQTVDKKQKQKIMKQIQDFDPSIMTENEASLLQHLLNPHIKDTDEDIKKMHSLIISNSALLNILQNKLMQYYEIKKFNAIKADVCKKTLKNIQLTSGEKIAHYLKTTATTVGVSTASAYILGSITDGVKEFLSPKEAEAADGLTGGLKGESTDQPKIPKSPEQTPPSGPDNTPEQTPPSGPDKLNTFDVPNTLSYYGNLLDSFNIIEGIGKSIYTFGTEGFGSALGVLTKTIEDQMNISNIAAKAIAVALFAYGMRSSDAHKWYARAGFGFLSMITLGGSTLISNIAKRFDFVQRRLQLGRNRRVMRYGTGFIGATYYDTYTDSTRTTRYHDGLDALENYLGFDADMRWNFGRLQDHLIWPRETTPTNLKVHNMRKDQSFAVRLRNGSVHVFTFVGIEGGRYLFNHRANSIDSDGRLRKKTTDKQVYFNVPGGISPIINVGGRFDLSNDVTHTRPSFTLEDVIDVKKEISIVDLEVNNLQAYFNSIYLLFDVIRLDRYTNTNLRNIESILNDGAGGYIGLESRVNNMPDSVEKDNLRQYIQNIRAYIDVLRRFIPLRPLLVNTLPPIVWPITTNITQIRNILNGINSFGSIPTLTPVTLPTGYRDITTRFTRFVSNPINNLIRRKQVQVDNYLNNVLTGFTDINIFNYVKNHINDIPDAGNIPIAPKIAGAAGGPIPPLNVNKGGVTVDIHNDVNTLLGLGYNFDEIATILNNTGYTLPPVPPATTPTSITAADIQRWHVS